MKRIPPKMRRLGLSGLAAVVLGTLVTNAPAEPLAAGGSPVGLTATEPESIGSLPGLRRLNQSQYVRSIEQIFGVGIRVPGRFEPPLRHGLMAVGDGVVTVSPSGVEQYELRAREIAAQVLSADRRASLLSCGPQVPTDFDRVCASSFLSRYGRLLYRRPLTQAELDSALALSQSATGTSHDFYKGLEIGLSRLLSSPKFIFRVEGSEVDPANPALRRLDDYSLASRISFLLWDLPPDSDLLDAAERGDLRDPAKLSLQVDRMMASSHFEQGVRAFFSDMFGFEQFDGLSKDQAIYPKYSAAMAKDAQEQLLRTIVDLLVTNKGDYRDLFTTRKTFLNRNLAALYQVPVEEGGIEGWVPHTFAPSEKRAGILTLAGFLMLDPTHEGRSSPTIRGKTVRELFLCEPVPAPPPNVNFAAVQNTGDLVHRTARERLSIHQENPACAGCHAITDPIGLSMENYDASGAFRTHENGALIDASGVYEGKSYKNVLDLQQLMRASASASSCVVQRAFEYGVGRAVNPSQEKWLEHAIDRFASDSYQFPALLRRIATSRSFASVAAEAPLAPSKVVAAR
ncbi:DUF1592 domain-containing protein [Pseudomonas sp.]|uniref:DUF1592 domain-containing protein n=1 Tax=Pseudomonas sp. TaxID=306 RepID=UPI0025D5CD0F|nr:DUF1592 domain-containing protein [Pseudomonas sp.]